MPPTSTIRISGIKCRNEFANRTQIISRHRKCRSDHCKYRNSQHLGVFATYLGVFPLHNPLHIVTTAVWKQKHVEIRKKNGTFSSSKLISILYASVMDRVAAQVFRTCWRAARPAFKKYDLIDLFRSSPT